ncbi:HDOD domain-containing protein [Chitinilyticum piscinae]|uniref:HDOD domain-containing protein n=1 Tax=Chitinilyticum piscinae TaxID=2866724 RepID=A0A8J7FFR8_9NEIS|nr:HDOD domain-containing protein [Chitinilyticum piscinae]MBE9608553.1 HDOD domain-containing protein [Chitinilyticum piscinae]
MKLEEVFEQTHRLPTIPKVVQELIDSFNDDSIDIGRIAQKISLDQVITAKVLRLANSVHFGATRRIGTVNEAMVVLGFNTVRTLVIASGITGAFIATPGFDRKHFWHKSLTVSSDARWLATQARVSPEMAFTCGILHNIGEMLVHVVSPETATQIEKHHADPAKSGDSAPEFDFVDASVELVRRWNFPALIVDALRHQDDPSGQVPPDALSAILNLAIRLQQQAHDQDSLAAALTETSDDLLAQAGLDREKLTEKLPELLDLRGGLDELVG